MFNRARIRLTLWFAGIFALIIVLIGVAVLFSARKALYDQVDDDLQARAQPILRSFRDEPFAPSRAAAIEFGTSGGYVFTVTGPRGNSVVASAGAEEVELPTLEKLEEVVSTDNLSPTDRRVGYTEVSTTSGDNLKMYVQPLVGSDGNVYFFQVGRSIEAEQQALRSLLLILLAGGAIGMLMSGWGGYWLAGLALRPIQKSLDAQREFVADASHELRTPLSLIRANAEILKRNSGEPLDPTSVDDIIKESDRLSYLVGQMLTLARADSHNLPLETEPVHLGALAEDIVRQMRLLALDKGIEITVSRSGDTIVDGDEQRLGELLIILLDNAVKYTDGGGSVVVSVGAQDSSVRLSVRDTGRGIAPEALPRVFDRFYRADKARSREMGGTGLGLAIAKWIVDRHGGTISAESGPGRGTTITMVLAAADMSPLTDSLSPEATPNAPDAAPEA